ncbi:MAG: sensor histidine kinase [Alphaproteobacteria bacterium]|nr:MAG: sensor histidine kinase [Alphaproteobacteria bacterium]
MTIASLADQRQLRQINGQAQTNGQASTGETDRAALTASLLREKELLSEMSVLSQQQDLMAQEFDHRLGNSLQMIVSLLSLQSLAAPTPEAADQLTIAAGRVAAFGRVHRRLHFLDRQKNVELKQYLRTLCVDIADLLLEKGAGRAVVVEGAEINLPTALGIPIGFLVAESITNSVKYATGDIIVHIQTSSPTVLLSISDDGPGLPSDFNPMKQRGLGMKLIQSLTKQIGGTLEFAPGDGQRGTRLTVSFAA